MAKRNAHDVYNGMQYGDGVPRSVPDGRVLAHNHVRHHARMSAGVLGFRWWTWPKAKVSEAFAPCGCGYAGLPHVARRDHAESYKCESPAMIRKYDRMA